MNIYEKEQEERRQQTIGISVIIFFMALVVDIFLTAYISIFVPKEMIAYVFLFIALGEGVIVGGFCAYSFIDWTRVGRQLGILKKANCRLVHCTALHAYRRWEGEFLFDLEISIKDIRRHLDNTEYGWSISSWETINHEKPPRSGYVQKIRIESVEQYL